ncbi:MAG TPA: M20/M25/M40 family metallo-hydrolase [Phycisphaerae bacterium]|nr:M20/M25/M40 family metallo-hydrolase [Phycisphaerae bacterium]
MNRIGLALLGVALAAGCQTGSSDADRRLVAEVITASEIAPNLRTLCMPGGRLSGSANGEAAEQWVANKVRSYGLSNVHFEPFAMTTWQDRSTEVTVMDDPPVTLHPAQVLGNCLSTPAEGITGELVDVGKGTADDFAAKADLLKGRIALAHHSNVHRGAQMRSALQAGAIGMLLGSDLEDQVVVGNCHEGPKPEPGVAIGKADCDKLAARLAAGEAVKVNIKVEAEAWECWPRNVVAEIPGRGFDAGDVVLVGAHLDSWHLAEGAIDNGTGSATILEAARALIRIDPHPRRTIRFVWFMGEEHGLLGSEAYVKQHAGELDHIVAMVNVDMPGEPRKIISFGHPEVMDLVRSVQQELPGYEIEQQVVEAHGGGSDHSSFMQQGICCLALHGDLGPGVKYYHSHDDKYEQVDRRGLNGAAAVIAVLAHRLAESPERPATRLTPTTHPGWH